MTPNVCPNCGHVGFRLARDQAPCPNVDGQTEAAEFCPYRDDIGDLGKALAGRCVIDEFVDPIDPETWEAIKPTIASGRMVEFSTTEGLNPFRDVDDQPMTALDKVGFALFLVAFFGFWWLMWALLS